MINKIINTTNDCIYIGDTVSAKIANGFIDIIIAFSPLERSV
tara:strand:+ start:190 stop:315 length:126 start_codon:yes stop_codon:yes gene_type:complete